MSRLVKADFDEVIVFLKAYSVAPTVSQADFVQIASRCHKRYFALMVFGAEIFDRQPGSSKGSTTQQAIHTRNIYFQEFISDMGGALFNWCHGAYKPAKLLLRSSLENLMKALSISESPSILTMTSVYEVFDTAAKTKVFSGRLEKLMFGRFRQLYASLCADAHGASLANMQQTKSLNYFPAFNAKIAEAVADFYCRIAQEALNVLCLAFKPVVIAMHYANNDAIAPLLSKSVKRALHEIDVS